MGVFAKRRYELFNLKMHMGVLQTAGTAFFLKKNSSDNLHFLNAEK